MVKDVADLPRRLNEAFYIAQEGRPGPVLVDLPKDVSAAVLKKDVSSEVNIPGLTIKSRELAKAAEWKESIKRVANLISQAKKPVIYAGNGSIKSAESV